MFRARLCRKERKLTKLFIMINILKRQDKCSDHLEKERRRRFSDDVLELFQNEENNLGKSKTRRRYTEKIKEFALTIYFYSPEAYRFLRTKLALPDESVLKKMISHTHTDA